MQKALCSRIGEVTLKSDPGPREDKNISQMFYERSKTRETKHTDLKGKNQLYLVKGWQGGLIKTMSKDNLLKSSSDKP